MDGKKYMLSFIPMLLVLFLASTLSLWSQNLRGTVFGLDEEGDKHVLPGAQLRWLGTKVGAITKTDGSFSIVRSDSSSRLVVNSISYSSDTIDVAKEQVTLEVTLKKIVIQVQGVTATADAPSISTAPLRTENISEKQLEQSACCSLAESFEKSPSVEVTFADAATGAKQIQLLGLRGIYTQMLTETVPMIRGLATPFGLDYIPGPFIKGISISKGAASVANGYEGITGQINVEYKKAQSDLPFFANAYLNQMGRSEINLTSARELSSTWHGMAMLHARTYRHEQDGNGDGFIDMPKFNQLNGMARVFHEGTVEFQFVGKALGDGYSSGTGTHSMQANTNHNYLIDTRTQRYEFFSKLAFMNVFSDDDDRDLALIVSGAWHDMKNEIGDRSYNGKEKTVQMKLVGFHHVSDDVRLTFGASYTFDNYDEFFGDYTLRRFDQYSFLRKESIPGAFTEATYTGIDDLTVVAGIRADIHNLYGNIITPRIHAKYNLTENTSLRVSAGSGMRVANLVSDNLSSFVNTRAITFGNNIQPERAWNYGASFTSVFELFNTVFTFDAEFYRTDFSNQVVVDYDRSAREVYIGNLEGKSYANSSLVQLQFTPLTGLDMNLAYRLIDTRTTTGGELRERPLISPHRVLSTFSYATEEQSWQFDATLIWNSGGRIPSTAQNPDSLRFANTFNPFFRMNGQITKRFSAVDIYLGMENITNFLQQKVYISPNDPHNEYFDGSLIWGPLDNRLVYLGARWRVE